MERFTVYILKCSDNSYYTGITNDIERRLWEHSSGFDIKSYTYLKRPVSLVFAEHFENPDEAIAWEKQIKGWSRKKKEALIQENWAALKKLSECQNDSHFKNFLPKSDTDA